MEEWSKERGNKWGWEWGLLQPGRGSPERTLTVAGAGLTGLGTRPPELGSHCTVNSCTQRNKHATLGNWRITGNLHLMQPTVSFFLP